MRMHALRVIPTFYPIHFERGRCGHSLAAVKSQGRHVSKQVQNPVQGIRAVRFVQPGWRGELPAWRQAEPVDPDRGLSANPTGVNSSTMKGPQGLASEFCGRRCQTAKDFHRRVRGCFYVRSPEITINIVVQTMPARESCAYDGGPSG